MLVVQDNAKQIEGEEQNLEADEGRSESHHAAYDTVVTPLRIPLVLHSTFLKLMTVVALVIAPLLAAAS